MGSDPRFWIKVEKVIIITVIYVLIGMVLPLLNVTILNSDFSLGPTDVYIFSLDLFSGALAGLTGGFLGGIVLVFIIDEKARKKPFRYGILLTAIFFVLIYYFTSFLIAFIQVIQKSGLPFLHPNVLEAVMKMVTAPITVITFVHWGVVVIATQFMLQVNDKFGQGILKNFLMGKYRKPNEEERIFMFLDIKASTTIAEKIGHHNYFKLLRDFYSDITNAIISTKGEIYQYVGDEIVVSWKMKNGLRESNCIRCFQLMRKQISRLGGDYKAKYGYIPEFKAGYHMGQVTAGEIGIIKRDVIYSGDVLNTCARIQEQCNHYKVDILLSEKLISLLDQSTAGKSRKLGDIALRGKEERVGLYTLLET